MPGHYFVAFELPQASPEDMARLDARLGDIGNAWFAGIGWVKFESNAETAHDAAESAFTELMTATRDLGFLPCPFEMVVEE